MYSYSTNYYSVVTQLTTFNSYSHFNTYRSLRTTSGPQQKSAETVQSPSFIQSHAVPPYLVIWLNHASRCKSELIVKFDPASMFKTNNIVIPWPSHHALISLTSTGVRRTEANTNQLSTKMTAYNTPALNSCM